ncbi:hypothetical protein NQ315_008657 [Exocentrus adspersus]|uniref:Ubiquitin activating enzyme 4 n=1 Tax=Exocentrus adspersus TaxID=1586481 RepID=A0AAV8W6E1_9CUCU|nr:hypothetical protein NQ315_008657 [Exocentrus adspersus]
MADTDVDQLKSEIKRLKDELHRKETLLQEKLPKTHQLSIYNDHLTTKELVLYSRQMLIRDIELEGQLKLKRSKVLIVGAGGLGCPASMYLARAGIGEITIMDYDEVELSNLHRQILYRQSDIGSAKAVAASESLESSNSHIKVIPLRLHANSQTLQDLLTEHKYDVVLDGSDNVATRYLLNDACVINNIPLVSGSALQMEGQLTVYHYKDGPCYRCLFPVPPPPETVTNCGDGGVLGPVVGVVGVLQALETIKICLGLSGVLTSRLLLIDGLSAGFRTVKLRGRNSGCAVCGDAPTVTSLIDYEQFCGARGHDKVENIEILQTDEQVHVKDIVKLEKNTIILDVRPSVEYEMCKLPNTVNLPYTRIQDGECVVEEIKKLFEENGTGGCTFCVGEEMIPRELLLILKRILKTLVSSFTTLKEVFMLTPGRLMQVFQCIKGKLAILDANTGVIGRSVHLRQIRYLHEIQPLVVARGAHHLPVDVRMRAGHGEELVDQVRGLVDEVPSYESTQVVTHDSAAGHA